MRRLFFPIVSFLIITISVSLVSSCDTEGNSENSNDTIDTALMSAPAGDSIKVVKGVVFDGAGNSVDIVNVETGDTMNFEYSYLPEDFRYRSEIDDTIEVHYICRIINGIDIDSVTLIKKVE